LRGVTQSKQRSHRPEEPDFLSLGDRGGGRASIRIFPGRRAGKDGVTLEGEWHLLRPGRHAPTTHIYQRPMGRVHEEPRHERERPRTSRLLALAREMGLPANVATIETFRGPKAIGGSSG